MNNFVTIIVVMVFLSGIGVWLWVLAKGIDWVITFIQTVYRLDTTIKSISDNMIEQLHMIQALENKDE